MIKNKIKILFQKGERRRIRKLRKFLAKHHPELLEEPLTPENLLKLATKYPLESEFRLVGIIYAILPVYVDGHVYSLVITDTDICYFKMTPKEFIDKLIQRKFGVYGYQIIASIYKEALKDPNLRYLPLAHEYLLLVPLTSINDPMGIWINAYHLDELILTKAGALIKLSFGLMVPCYTKELNVLTKNLSTAFKIHAFIKKFRSLYEPANNEPLQHYLNARDSALIDATLQSLTINDLENEPLVTFAARSFMITEYDRRNVPENDQGTFLLDRPPR